MVTNISAVPPNQGLIIHSNGGSQFTFHKAHRQDIGTVWFNPRAITNILSFSKLWNQGLKLAYDFENDMFHLTINNRTYLFKQIPEGLYAYHHGVDSIICATTAVADKTRMYTPTQIMKADEGRKLYRLLGRPSERVSKHMLTHQLIKSTDLTSTDISHATDIYGPDVGCLKGKTVRATPAPVKIPVQIPLPEEIKQQHSDVVICADVCHVDGL